MARWRSHPELLVMMMALAVWAGCSKRPVDYQRSAGDLSTRGAQGAAPGPAVPTEPSSTTPRPDDGSTGPSTPPPADAPLPATPLVGAQRPSPGEYRDSGALKDIYFDFDRYAISPDAARILMANAAWLKSNPGTAVLVEGHCDGRGTVEYNLALGQRRAQSARDFLLAQGIPAARMATVSYGKERPACSDATEECWARNRRAHFLIKPS
jgi:peptidoglycan-associated lipoprotein